MSTILELKSLINTQLNRDTIYDSALDGIIGQAGKKLERNYDFQYMSRFVSTTGTSGVRTLSLPSAFIKRIDMMRLVQTDGKYKELEKVSPQEVLENLSGDPSFFWLDGRSSIYLDNTPDRDITFEYLLVELFDWDSLTDSSTSWLISEGQDALMWEALIILAVADRDKELYTLAKNERNDALRTLILADEAYRQGGEGNSLRYLGND